jgi:hypothetical protein
MFAPGGRDFAIGTALEFAAHGYNYNILYAIMQQIVLWDE